MTNSVDIRNVLTRPEYQAMLNSPFVKDKLLFVTFGGSIAYGLNTPESDIDTRGVIMPPVDEILGVGSFYAEANRDNKNLIYGKDGFEQFLDVESDTTFYTLKKAVSLMANCNPNTIELLGCKPEHYANVSAEGQILLDNKDVFLSKRAHDSFAGYARAQFQRLKNALGNGGVSSLGNVISLADSINRMQSHLERSYPGYSRDMVKLSVGTANHDPIFINGEQVRADDIKVLFLDKNSTVLTLADGTVIPDEDIQLFLDVNFTGIRSQEFSSVCNEITSALKEFNKHIGHRNNKKDDYHLNKHAMHLVRLYLMAFDILERGEIVTCREKDRDFLMSIKTGYYMHKNDRSFKQEFFDLVSAYDVKLDEIVRRSKLPDKPDYMAISNIVKDITYKYILSAK